MGGLRGVRSVVTAILGLQKVLDRECIEGSLGDQEQAVAGRPPGG